MKWYGTQMHDVLIGKTDKKASFWGHHQRIGGSNPTPPVLDEHWTIYLCFLRNFKL